MRATISGGSASSTVTARSSSIMCTANIYDVDAEQRFEFSEAEDSKEEEEEEVKIPVQTGPV